MGRLQVLMLGSPSFATAERDKLAREYELIPVEAKDKAEFMRECEPKGRYSAARAMFRSGGDRLLEWDDKLVQALPSDLKFICSMGAGYDALEPVLDALSERGIQVSHTPRTVDNATSTVAMFLILSCFRQLYASQAALREGKWRGDLPVAHDPDGKLLGIIGLGGIGQATARHAASFGMRLAYHSRHEVDPETLRKALPGLEVAYHKELDDLLAVADCVAISIPLSASTKDFFSAHQFGKMKKGAILVNTARGPIVNEDALLAALDSGHLASAGLDVFPDEPAVNPKLIANRKLTLTPHIGTATAETLARMETQVMDNIRAGLETGRLPDLVSEQKGRF